MVRPDGSILTLRTRRPYLSNTGPHAARLKGLRAPAKPLRGESTPH